MAVIAVSAARVPWRIALLEGDDLREFYLWHPEAGDGVDDVYTGRVEAVMPVLAGCFVELGGLSGFLPDSAGGRGLGQGDMIAVVTTRAAQGGKGPRLARHAGAVAAKPGLMARGGGPLRALAARHPAARIEIDDYAAMASLRAELEGRLHHAPPFDAVLEDEISVLFSPTVTLPGGAVLHITSAPAATLLDVDAGPASGVPALALNLALIPALCRQIVLRNLSGGILIDFAGMKSAHRARLGAALKAALAADPLRPECLGFSHLGFAELTRRRVRPPLSELTA
jgi:Ribonuclease G/E